MSDYFNSLDEEEQLEAVLVASREDRVKAPPGLVACHTESEFFYNGELWGNHLCWFIAIADGLRKSTEERWEALQCLELLGNLYPLDPIQRENVARHWRCCVVEHDAGNANSRTVVGPRDAEYVVHVHLKAGHYSLLMQESEVMISHDDEERLCATAVQCPPAPQTFLDSAQTNVFTMFNQALDVIGSVFSNTNTVRTDDRYDQCEIDAAINASLSEY